MSIDEYIDKCEKECINRHQNSKVLEKDAEDFSFPDKEDI